eukprot:scaffold11462_cov140-Isochrysis_galbana.AAC.1
MARLGEDWRLGFALGAGLGRKVQAWFGACLVIGGVGVIDHFVKRLPSVHKVARVDPDLLGGVRHHHGHLQRGGGGGVSAAGGGGGVRGERSRGWELE